MIAEKPSLALTENLLTLLAQSDEHGKIVANIVDASLFEGEMQNIAARCIQYWKRHGEAPKSHTPDLFSDILEDRHNRLAGTYRRILSSTVQLHEDGINAKYVLDSIRQFVRLQKFRIAVLQAAQQLNRPTENTIEEVEALMQEVIKARDFQFHPGTRLHDYEKLLLFLGRHFDEFDTGIEDLDEHQAVPARGKVWLHLAGTGQGKTWAMVHIGKRALMRRKKVLHISPEISEEEVQQRYYQSMFSMSLRPNEKIEVPRFKTDVSRLIGLKRERLEPDFDFQSPELQFELETRVGLSENRMANILIKQVPPRSMSSDQLRGFLDSLEQGEGFIPDLLIFDSIYLMKHNSQVEYRHSLGANMEDFRAICIERNMAGVASHQLSKEGAKVKVPTAKHIGEDWSMAQTADVVLIHAATEAERQYGLARLYADKVRSAKDKFAVLITQCYDIGQYCLESVRLRRNYWDEFEPKARDADEEEEEEE